MLKAFVFGKFLPFHKGHEAMIRFAQTKCDFLSVLVCASDQEKIAGTIRKNWIDDTFSNEQNINVEIFNYLESNLPNTSESSEEVSKVWAEIFLEKFPDYPLLITSEPYGNFVAKFMDIQHISFDNARQSVPVSATKVRKNLFENWDFLPDSVKPYFAIKVVILGTESTGKSTLTKRLAQHFKGSYVQEAGRDLVPDSRDFELEDLALVAEEYAHRINEAATGPAPLIIIDTDIHITKSYAEFCFQKTLKVKEEILKSNQANLYLYLNNDVPHIQDGTRMNEAERNLLDQSHRKTLKDHDINFIEIKGTYEERFQQSVTLIIKLLETQNRDLLAITSPKG